MSRSQGYREIGYAMCAWQQTGQDRRMRSVRYGAGRECPIKANAVVSEAVECRC